VSELGFGSREHVEEWLGGMDKEEQTYRVRVISDVDALISVFDTKALWTTNEIKFWLMARTLGPSIWERLLKEKEKDIVK
jgi:hypothetical protein